MALIEIRQDGGSNAPVVEIQRDVDVGVVDSTALVVIGDVDAEGDGGVVASVVGGGGGEVDDGVCGFQGAEAELEEEDEQTREEDLEEPEAEGLATTTRHFMGD